MMVGMEVPMARLLQSLLYWASTLFAVDSETVAKAPRANRPLGPDGFGH